MASILSTKLLTDAQKNLVWNAGLSLTEYNFITTHALSLAESISEVTYRHAIITSQTTVGLVKNLDIKTCFCVGEKTASKLRSLGFNVDVVAESGQELAQLIVKKYSNLSFTFFGSAQRIPELSELLQSHGIHLTEILVYETLKTPKPYQRPFDAVLCFSPSAVDSYFESNPESKAKIICIGPTTAKQAKLYTSEIVVSSHTSIESVIVKAVNVLKLTK
jgi:uroporphyrinogen-III synthase